MRVDIYSHNFAVTDFDFKGKEALFGFCERYLVQYELVKTEGRYIKKKLRTFAASNRERSVFRFHLNSFGDFKSYMFQCGYNLEAMTVVKHEVLTGEIVNYDLIDTREPRDYQVNAIEYCQQPPVGNFANNKIITIQTGRGKTMLALRAIFKRNMRCVCIIKGMYVEKWIEDYEGSFGKHKGELMVVRGSKDLKNLIALSRADELVAKFIIITNTTMYNFLFAHETFNGITDYDLHPIDFFPLLKTGIRLIDEVHQDFHLNFRLDLYTHVERTINLSATMDPDDPFLKKMYELMFPLATRFEGIEYNRYINVKALRYQLNDPKRARYRQFGRNSYSQIAYEAYIIKNPKVLQNYLRLIGGVVETSFLNVMEKGQKMLIFAGTVEMCGLITTYLNEMYRNKNLTIRRYTAEDPFEFLMDSDISVSTLKSAGTAVDIPGLRITLMTDAMNSRQANDQALGRLRELHAWPDIKPEFIYFICMDIDKHNEYHQRKMDNFRGKVLTHQALNTGIRI